MKYQFTHMRLLVNDFPACFRFYRDVMRLKVSIGEEESSYAEFKTGKTILALFGRQAMAEVVDATGKPAQADAQDRVVLAFAVKDADKAYRRLLDKGAEMVAAPQDRPAWSIRTAHFRDPDGNLIEINARLGS